MESADAFWPLRRSLHTRIDPIHQQTKCQRVFQFHLKYLSREGSESDSRRTGSYFAPEFNGFLLLLYRLFRCLSVGIERIVRVDLNGHVELIGIEG